MWMSRANGILAACRLETLIRAEVFHPSPCSPAVYGFVVYGGVCLDGHFRV